MKLDRILWLFAMFVGIVCFAVLAGVYKAEDTLFNVLLIIWVLVLLIVFILVNRNFVKKNKAFNENIQKLVETNNFDEALTEVRERKSKYKFSTNWYLLCQIYIITILFMKDDIEQGVKEITGTSFLLKRYFQYFLALVHLEEGNISKAEDSVKALQKIRSNSYVTQQDLSKKLMALAKGNNVDVSVFETSKFPIVKRIVEKYVDLEWNLEKWKIVKSSVIKRKNKDNIL